MKLLLYIVTGFVAMAAAALIVTGGQAPESHPLTLFGLVMLFGIPPVGSFWMMYVSIRYERKPLPILLLAFIPFTFLWYYFERVRPGKLTKTRDFS